MNFINQNSLHSEYGGYGLPTCFSGYKNDKYQATTNFAKNVQLDQVGEEDLEYDEEQQLRDSYQGSNSEKEQERKNKLDRLIRWHGSEMVCKTCLVGFTTWHAHHSHMAEHVKCNICGVYGSLQFMDKHFNDHLYKDNPLRVIDPKKYIQERKERYSTLAKKRQREESQKPDKKHKFKRSQLPDNRTSNCEEQEDQDDVSWYMNQLFKDSIQQDDNIPEESQPIMDEVEEISPLENNDIELPENDQLDSLDKEINCGHDQIDSTDQGINSSEVSKSLDGSDVKQQDASFNRNFGFKPKIERRRYEHDVVFKKVKYFQDDKFYKPIKPFCGIKEYAVVESVKEEEKVLNYFSSDFEHENGNTGNTDVKDNPFNIKNDLFDIKDDPFDIEDDPLDAVDSNNQSVSGSTEVCSDQNKNVNKIVPGNPCGAVVSSSMSLLMGYDSDESDVESPSVPHLNSSTDKHKPVDVSNMQNLSNKNGSEIESCKNLSPVNMTSNKFDFEKNSEDVSDPKRVYNKCDSIKTLNPQFSLGLDNVELKYSSFGDCKNVLGTVEDSKNEIVKNVDSSRVDSLATDKKKARRGSRGRKRRSGAPTAESSTNDSFADVENKDSNISEPNLIPVVDDNKCDHGAKIVKAVKPTTEAIKSESRFAHLKPITKSDKRYSNKNVIIRDLDPESSEITHLHNTLAREEKLSEIAHAKKRKIFDKKYGQSLLNILVNGRVGSRNGLFNSDSE